MKPKSKTDDPCPAVGFCGKISITLNTCTIDKKKCSKYRTFKVQLEQVQQKLQGHPRG